MATRWGKSGKSGRFYWGPKSLQMVIATMKLRDACSLEEKYDKPRQHIKMQKHHFASKGLYNQSYGFSSNHVWMWEWTIKKAICMLSCFSCVQFFATLWTVAHQAPLSRGFSTQEYWNGLPYPLAGALLNLRTEPAILIHFLRLLHWQAVSLPEAPLGKPKEGWTPKNWCFWIVLL